MEKESLIGKTIWRFDSNRRVYRTGENSPIYSEHWYPVVVESETSKSWVTNFGDKVAKNGAHLGWAFTEKERDDDIYINTHGYKIAGVVERLKDADMLREIAEIVKYEAGGNV